MSIDLQDAFGRAVESATTGHPGIPAAPVLARIRRRRAVRTTATGAVGLAAVGAVAVAGSHLGGARGGPTQPAGIAVTSTEDVADCGAPVPEALDGASGDPTRLLARLATGVAPAGGTLEVVTGLDVGGDGFLGYPTTQEPQILLARDGRVVSLTTPADPENDLPVGGTAGAELTLPVELPLVDCATGEPPPPGEYQVQATWTVDSPAPYDVDEPRPVRVGNSWLPERSTNPPVTLLSDLSVVTIEAAGTADDPDGPLGPGWTEADPAATAHGLPLVAGPVVAAAEGVGGEVRVVVEAEAGRESADAVVRALEAGGYAVTHQETDGSRPFWTAIEATGPAGTVAVDVSNETGGGWYADYTFETSAP